MSRVVVVGAGLAGLSAAARLAALGHDVVVCEQAEQVGGKLGRFSRDGFSFDTGPSLLTLPAVQRDLFLKTGAPIESVLDVVPLDPVAHYRFADGTELDLPGGGLPRVAAALDDALGAGTGEQWTRFLQRAAAVWDVARGPFLESPLEGPRTLLRLARSASDVRTVAPWTSLRSLGRRHLHDPRLRVLLDRYATYSGSHPAKAPAALATVPFVEQAFGAWYVRGGLHRLAVAVAERARERGVRVRTGAAVERVLEAAGRAAGVRLAGGEELRADVVVSAVDAAHLYRDLLPRPRLRPDPRRRSSSGFVLLLALDGRTPGLRHHTVLFPDDYDAEFADLAAGRPVADPTVYVSAPDDPALRPSDGTEAWFVLVNAPVHDPGARAPGGTDWADEQLVQRYTERVLATMARRGLDVRGRLRWCEVRTPADLARQTGSDGGAIYGTSSDGARSAFLRPANRSPVPGLFLVGGSAHPGGGLPLVGLSARIVADLVGPA
ncbi:phytoene desaturase family protein [Paenibacillus sp. TRM 82003]|uniref:phytoene desaturase family protein n=1 Tax=Kineococcus sp. TRM81007 TaxID=2925831 RepID=UPI001F562A3A|nr:phytoene desaturase family protein [Kineococcus sp. TRM81007]MCI2239680.1 phytoene desaturase family protein [Kineococcus sp. TRM81007]MCI3926757.1 phytoene desaturase family protein [Paenibacillus sp. TRM 82003]